MKLHCLLLLLLLPVKLAYAGGNVENPPTGLTPLNELGAALYMDAPGGLYPGGSNSLPTGHASDGRALAAQIQPLDASGNPSPTGKIGIITTGMSNAHQVFGKVGDLMDGLWAPNVVYVNGAQGSMDAVIWADGSHGAWNTALDRIAAAGLTPAQVQVALNFHAVAHLRTPAQPWPDTPGDLQAFQEAIAGHLQSFFTNLKLSFWGTREYGGYGIRNNNPEPYAYQSGFAVKWIIERQINGDPELNFDPSRGPVRVPWMAWGPYLWADGLRPRTDGLLWEPRDFQADGTHPSIRGRVKQAGAWVNLLRTSPFTAGWIVPMGNLAPVCAVVFPKDRVLLEIEGPVALEAFAQDDDGRITHVEFHTGTTLLGSKEGQPYSLLWQPPGPGEYPIHAVAYDDDGSTRRSRVITTRIGLPSKDTLVLASDSFESGDFLGGAGWNTASWIVSGPASVVNIGASDGNWSARLGAGSQIARSFPLHHPEEARLEFAWRGNLPEGASLILEVRDTAWQTVFSQTNEISSTWQTVSLPLSPFEASGTFGVRFRVSGSDAFAGVDNVRILSDETAPRAAPLLATLNTFSNKGLLLRWRGTDQHTYQVLKSSSLSTWSPVYFTTIDETSEISYICELEDERAFFRVEVLTP